ncbi:hypothetical protein BRADI_1g04403v3 [Brachypodium distachyon]|uniref:Uncharacterized protein n=1 Tax=Brachypodium distachyon TaxID=15368 RepID=A0A0Q3GNE3_BRADI|nr:hypothetical protein BRADI_1g04403v3 [Brachypodium distachyon]
MRRAGGSSSLLKLESGSSSARNPFLSRAFGTWRPPHVVCYGCGGANQLEQRRRHLYLALDDWEKGFSLYKLSLDYLLLGSGAGDDDDEQEQRLPDPILRLGFRTVGPHPQFHALGSNIVVTTSASKSNGGKGLTLVYDTETAELHSYVSARALHPDGHTIDLEDRAAGYSWARRGDWCLPFYGDASYDADLGAWVGTRNVQDGCCSHDHLCSCDVVPAAAAGDEGLAAPPAWTVAAGRLTFLEPGMKPKQHRHRLLSIASGGGGGGVCYFLVEPAVRQEFGYGSGDRRLLRLTLFRARYGMNGELLASPLRRQQQPARSYLISRNCACA